MLDHGKPISDTYDTHLSFSGTSEEMMRESRDKKDLSLFVQLCSNQRRNPRWI
jgi:hypothetical protein